MTEPTELSPIDLDVRVATVGDAHVVTVSGELDVDSAPSVSAAVDTALKAHPPLLVLDLTNVHFFGSPGLSLLLGTQERVLDAGGALAVVADHRPVLRPLQVAGVAAVLDLFASREEALREVLRGTRAGGWRETAPAAGCTGHG